MGGPFKVFFGKRKFDELARFHRHIYDEERKRGGRRTFLWELALLKHEDASPELEEIYEHWILDSAIKLVVSSMDCFMPDGFAIVNAIARAKCWRNSRTPQDNTNFPAKEIAHLDTLIQISSLASEHLLPSYYLSSVLGFPWEMPALQWGVHSIALERIYWVGPGIIHVTSFFRKLRPMRLKNRGLQEV